MKTIPSTTLPLTPYAMELAAHLDKHGINVIPVVFDIVPIDKPRVRVSINADKMRNDVD